MANIYIRVPWHVAAYYRGRCEDKQLTEWEPIEFKDYTQEYHIMMNNLRYMLEATLSRTCLSQKAFQNLLRGKRVTGGPVIVQRDPKTWPTPQECCTLLGTEATVRQLAYDYLCIEMPRETYVNKTVHRTNSCYALAYDTAKHLQDMLVRRFKLECLDWTIQDRDYCNINHIHRKKNERAERFLEQYNILPQSAADYDSLRRQYNRWVKDAEMYKADRINFGHSFLTHISEEEKERSAKRKWDDD